MYRRLAKASVAIILIYTGVILLNSYNAYGLRSDTDKILFSGYFDSSKFPHIYIPRMILYIEGSSIYNLDILRMAKRQKNKIDCYFIKKLERKTEAKAIINNLHELVKHDYGKCIAKAIALDPRVKLIDIVKHQDNNDSFDKFVDVSKFIDSLEKELNENELIDFLEINTSTKYHDWVSDVVSMTSTTSETINYETLFKKLEPSMKNWQKAEFLSGFSKKTSYKNINQLINLFEENKDSLDKDTKDKLVFSILYKSKIKEDWMIDYFRNSKGVNPDIPILSVYSSSQGKLPWVNNDLSYLHEIAKLSVSVNSDLASYIYHILMHELELEEHSDNDALRVIRKDIESLLSAPDNSKLKKNLIVLSTRHPSSQIHYGTIDNAFSQGEPRTFLFTDASQYIKNSTATKNYETISENSYISDENKYRVWPIRPYSNNSQEKILSKIPMWEEFIKKYPFHPGIDDAYLRVSFDLYNTNQLIKAFEKISEYFSKDISHDISARDRIKALLAHTLSELEYKDVPTEYKVVKYMYELASCTVDNNCKKYSSLDLVRIDKEIIEKITFLEKDQINRFIYLAKLNKIQVLNQIRKNQDDRIIIIILSSIVTNETATRCIDIEECSFILNKKQCFSDDYLCAFSHKPTY